MNLSLDDIFEVIIKIPIFLEAVVGAFVYFVVYLIMIQAISDTARESICVTPTPIESILCFYFTNSLLAFISTVLVFIALGAVIRSKIR